MLLLSNPLLLLLMVAVTFASSQRQTNAAAITEIRLEGGRGHHEGNIQVRLGRSSEWVYICDDGFGFPEADLICQHLGFERADRFTKNNHFGLNTPERRRSSPNFLSDRLDCSANDTSYQSCPLAEQRTHDCVATEVAGVECRTAVSRCQPDEFPCRASSTCIPREEVCDGIGQCPDNSDDAEELCSDISVTRIVGNRKINIKGAVLGTVQVKYNEEWGTACYVGVTESAAKVMCRSMGYGNGWSVLFTRSYLGEAEGRMLITPNTCRGDEEWLGQCPDAQWDGFSICSESGSDLGVFCYSQDVEVRLAGNGSPRSGRVELKLGGQWGSVCDNGFDVYDARVICGMLGYHGKAVAHRMSGRGTGPIWDIWLDCLARDKTIQDCRIRIMDDSCQSFNTAGVTCSQRPDQTDAELRDALGVTECGVAEDASSQFLTNLGKVRGGSRSVRFDSPWLVSLSRRREAGGRLSCGGALISEDYVLSAAHCFDFRGRLDLVVRVGDYNLDFIEDSEEDFDIKRYWIHEQSDENAFNDNDLALVMIQRKNGRGIRFGPRVKPICLPSSYDTNENLSRCSVVGWGETFLDSGPSSRPHEGETTIVSDYVCEGFDRGGPRNFTSSFICVNTPRVLFCSGDSGGPMACPVDGRQTLYGIVSSGLTCKAVNSADLYIRVSKFIDWILEKVQSSRHERFS